MKVFRTALFLSICLMAGACGARKSSMYEAAVRQLPISLGEAMTEYMETVGEPTITGLQVILDCESICILQCKASAPDAFGKRREDTVRYTFVRDNMLSAAYGRPVYLDHVTGAKYLDKAGIREFVKDYQQNRAERYAYYLGISAPVEAF